MKDCITSIAFRLMFSSGCTWLSTCSRHSRHSRHIRHIKYGRQGRQESRGAGAILRLRERRWQERDVQAGRPSRQAHSRGARIACSSPPACLRRASAAAAAAAAAKRARSRAVPSAVLGSAEGSWWRRDRAGRPHRRTLLGDEGAMHGV